MANMASVRRPRDRGSAPAFSFYVETRRAACADPWEVVLDPNLTCSEKKEILLDWASAVRAIDGRPDRTMGAAGAVASWDDLMEGLRLVNAEIAALSRPRTVTRPSHLKPAVRSRSARTG